MNKHIHILGASGSGTSTLGKHIAEKFNYVHIDTDDFYWIKTNPPFIKSRPIDERVQLLKEKLDSSDKWVLSGSLVGWGDVFIPYFDLVIFMWIPKELRLKRLEEREEKRYGDKIKLGGQQHRSYTEFINWASQYDEGDETIRSKKLHEAWLASLDCQILRLEGDLTMDKKIEKIKKVLTRK